MSLEIYGYHVSVLGLFLVSAGFLFYLDSMLHYKRKTRDRERKQQTKEELW